MKLKPNLSNTGYTNHDSIYYSRTIIEKTHIYVGIEQH